MATKLQEISKYFACKYGVVEFKYATGILDRVKELPWQPKLCKNKPKFRRFQFSKSYGDNVCVYRRVFVVGEFKYANKNSGEQRE